MKRQPIVLNRRGKIALALMIPLWILASVVFIYIGRNLNREFTPIAHNDRGAEILVTGTLMGYKVAIYDQAGRRYGLDYRGILLIDSATQPRYFLLNLRKNKLDTLAQQLSGKQGAVLTVQARAGRAYPPPAFEKRHGLYAPQEAIGLSMIGPDRAEVALVDAGAIAQREIWRGYLFIVCALLMIAMAGVTAYRLIRQRPPFTS